MDILVIVYLVLAIGTLVVSARLFGDIYSPVAVMGFIWFLVLALYELRLYPYDPLKASTTLDLLTGIGMYLAGCTVGRLMVAAPSGDGGHAGPSVIERLDSDRLRTAIVWLWIVGTLGFVGMFLRVVSLYGVTGFFEDPELVHDNFTVRFLGYPWLSNIFTPVLAFLYLKKVGKSAMIVGAGMTALFWLVISISRTNVIQCAFMAVFAASFLGLTRRDLRYLVVTGVATILFFSFFAFLKDPSHAERLEHSKFQPKELRIFASAYGYFTAPIATYEAIKEDHRKFDYGINTFVTGVKVLNLVGFHLPIPPKPQKFYSNPIRCNVGTYLDVYYKDFGFFGIVVLSFLQGVFVMVLYSLMKARAHYHLFFVNAVLSWCLFTTFFANHFKDNAFIFECIVGYLIGRYLLSQDMARTGGREVVSDSLRRLPSSLPSAQAAATK